MADVIADLLVRVGADISGMQTGLDSATDRIASFGQKMTAVGGALTELGLPLVAFGGLAAKVAGDFESQMNVLAVAARGGGTSLEELRDVAIKAGSDVSLVGVSAADVAGAMTGFTKAGLDTNEMLGNMQGYLDGTAQLGGALRAAIDLAAASELDLKSAGDLVTTTMATFGLSADQASAAMNSYVQTADASVASVGDLGAAMVVVGSTMAAFGQSLGDTNIALALLSTRGITGAEAGQALKSMFTNMLRDTPEVTKALNDLNVSLYDQAGNMRPLPAIVADLSGAMAGMTQKERDHYIQLLAGTEGMRAMNTLLAEGTPGWNDMATAISGAASMQETAAAKTQGFNAAMENLKSSIETFMINVGTPLINDVLTPMVSKFTDIVGTLTTVNPKFAEMAVIGGGVMTAFGGILVVGGQIAGAVANLSPLLGVIGGIGGAIGGLLPILAPIAAAIAVFAAAWNNNWFGIRDTLGPIIENIKGLITALLDWILKGDIKGVFAGLFNVFGADTAIKIMAFIEDTKKILGGLVDWFNTGNWRTMIPAILDVFGPNTTAGVIGFVQEVERVWGEFAGWINANLVPVFRDVVAWLKQAIPDAINYLSGLWTQYLAPAINTVWGAIKDNLLPILRDIVGFIAGDLKNVFQSNTFGLLKQAAEDVWKFIRDSFIPALRDVVSWLATNLGPAITAAAGFFANTLLPAVRNVWDFFKTYILPILSEVARVMDAVLGLAVRALAGLWENVLKPALVGIFQFIGIYLKPVFEDLGELIGENGAVGKAIKWVKELFDKLGPALAPIKTYLGDIATFFGTLADKINNLKLPDWLTPGSPTPLEIALYGILGAVKAVAGGPWGWIDPLLKLFGIGGGGAGGGQTININVTVGPDAVKVEGADPQQLASAVGEAIWRALQALVKSETAMGGAGAGGGGWSVPW